MRNSVVHERSLARAILREALTISEQRRLGTIQGVVLELGEFSGVESTLLQSAVEEVSVEEMGRRISAEIHLKALEACCAACGQAFYVQDFHFQCPTCASVNVDIIHGEELRLLSLVTDSAEADRCH